MGGLRQCGRGAIRRQGSGIVWPRGSRLCLFGRREAVGFAHFPECRQGNRDGYAQSPEDLGAVGVVIGSGNFLPHDFIPFGRLLVVLER